MDGLLTHYSKPPVPQHGQTDLATVLDLIPGAVIDQEQMS